MHTTTSSAAAALLHSYAAASTSPGRGHSTSNAYSSSSAEGRQTRPSHQASSRAQGHNTAGHWETPSSDVGPSCYDTPLLQRQQHQHAETSLSARSSLSSLSINELYELTRPGKALAQQHNLHTSQQHQAGRTTLTTARPSRGSAQAPPAHRHSSPQTAAAAAWSSASRQPPLEQQQHEDDLVGPHISSLQLQISTATDTLRELYQSADNLGLQPGQGSGYVNSDEDEFVEGNMHHSHSEPVLHESVQRKADARQLLRRQIQEVRHSEGPRGVSSPSRAAAPQVAWHSPVTAAAAALERGIGYTEGAQMRKAAHLSSYQSIGSPGRPTRVAGVSSGRSQELQAQVDLLRSQLAEERVAREVGSLEEARLKGWIQEMRSERRRLEDRLMGPNAAGVGHVQEMREELDQQVLALSRQRDSLQAESAELQHTSAVAASLGQENGVLRQALGLERQRGSRYREVRVRMESHLEDIVQQLEALRVQHQQAVVSIQADSDQLSLKLRKAGRRKAILDSELEGVRAHLLLTQSQLQERDIAIGDLHLSLESVQSGGQQQLLQLEVSLVQLQDRLTESLLSLHASHAEIENGKQANVVLVASLTESHQETADALTELKDSANRGEYLRGEREKILKVLATEQVQAAALRTAAEVLHAQVQALEGKCLEAERAAACTLVSTQRQHEADIETIHQQHDTQLAAADKQYSLLQIQVDCSGDSHDKMVAVQGALRRERDELWAEAENLKADIETLVREKDEVVGKLNALRNEVKSTIDQVMQDREQRLSSMSVAHESSTRSFRNEYEAQLTTMQGEYEKRLAGLLELSEHLRKEASDSVSKSEKAKGTVTHLKEQVRDMLVQRDDLDRELQTEKQYSEELNRILVQIRSSGSAL